jgi:putative transposase
MAWSFVYPALRRVPELMVLAGGRRTPGRWRSWSSPHQLAVLRRQHPRPRLQTCAACGPQPPAAPGPDGRSSWSHPRCGMDGTAAWGPGAGPIQRRHAASHRFPQQVQTLIVRLATENPRWGDQRIRGERWALAARSPPAPSPGFLRANGLPRGATLASLAPADPAVPQLHWSRRGQGVESTTRGATGLRPAGSGVSWVRR